MFVSCFDKRLSRVLQVSELILVKRFDVDNGRQTLFNRSGVAIERR
jgi:hypothetical protein